jgi:hypothetical protein
MKMNKGINKIIKIDGAPGITLEGKKGDTGKNGGMMFFTDGTRNSLAFSVFDIWPNDYVSSTPMFVDKCNFCEFTTPDSRDYILTHVQNIAYVYIVNVLIDRNSIIKNDLSEYIENGSITEEYAEKILDYYGSGMHSKNDCCLVSEITSLTFFANVQGNIFDLVITKSSVNVDYTGYTGVILENNKMGVKDDNSELAVFNIVSAENSDLRNIKIEAEFYTDEFNAGICSIYPHLWADPSNVNVLSMNYPSGYLENYNYKTNYDDENLENFTVILKDFEEGPDVVRRIPMQLLGNYSICIYAYVPEDADRNTCNKYFITEFQGSELMSS